MLEYMKQRELVDSQGLKILFIYCIFNFEYQTFSQYGNFSKKIPVYSERDSSYNIY